MRIKQISVTELFGTFNHTIPLNLEKRITIIHGPNGFGKTILLKMLDGLFNSHYSKLRTIPFKEFRVDFDNKDSVWVDKQTNTSNGREGHGRKVTELAFHYSRRSKEQSFSLASLKDIEKNLPFPPSVIEGSIPGLERITSREWLYSPTKEILSLEEVIERFSDILPFKLEREPKWWRELKTSVSIRFIETQRLLNISHPSRSFNYGEPSSMLVPAVTEYSKELAQTIKSKLAESAELSQSLDRTFPRRLVEQQVPTILSNDELRNKLSQLEEKRSRLKEAGLLDKDEDVDFQVPQQIDETTKSVLSVYIKDVEDKLGVFDTLANKIDLFNEIVNNRFLYKKMAISKDKGFTFITSGEPLSLGELSSGEQHELVLLYELLFKVEPNSLVLIDEPELSLHVGWQVQFLKDLQRITQLASFDILIATHSPDIINDRWDLTVRLKGPEE